MIILGLASPVFSQIFLDDILTKKHPDWIFNFLLAMTVSFIVCGVMNFLQSVILTRWQRKLTLSDSSKFFWHLLRLPMQFFNQRYAAEVAGRVNFNESIAGVLSGPAATAILNLFVAIFYLLLLLQYNVTLTIIGIFFSSVDIIIFLALRRKLTDLQMKIQQDASKSYGVAMNGLSMIETIKANGNEADFFCKMGRLSRKSFVGEPRGNFVANDGDNNSKNFDHRRRVYARRAKTIKRSNVFFGTTNNARPLKDFAEARPFPIIKCNNDYCTFKEGLTKSYINKLWAEIFQKYNEFVRLDGGQFNDS